MYKAWLMRITIVGAVASIIGLALAQPWVSADPWWGWGFTYLQEKLGLSEKQSKKITQLRAKVSSRIGELMGKLSAKRSELRALWLAPTPDKRRLQQVMRETLKLQQELLRTRTEGMIDMMDVLTPEQLILLREEAGWFSMCPMCAPGMGYQCPMRRRGTSMLTPMRTRRGMCQGMSRWW